MITMEKSPQRRVRMIYTSAVDKNGDLIDEDKLDSGKQELLADLGDYLPTDTEESGDEAIRIRDGDTGVTSAEELHTSRIVSWWNEFLYIISKGAEKTLQRIWSDINPPVHKIITFCRTVPLVFAIIVALSALIIPEIRHTLIQKSMMDRVILFMSDVIIFLTLGFTFGFAKMPVNYIFLMITKQFALANDFQLMSTEGLKLKEVPFVSGLEHPFLTFTLAATFFGASVVITKLSRINVGRCDSLILLATLVIPTIGTFILLSSLCMDLMGKELHLGVCRVWSSLAFVASIFIMLSVYQQLILPSNRKYYFSQQLRTHLETTFCYVQMYYVCRYILVIHPEFSFKDIFSRNNALYFRFMVPKDVLRLWENSFPTKNNSEIVSPSPPPRKWW